MSLQPCALSVAPQQTHKARSLIARFCALAKSEHPANVRKRLPRCRSFPCIDVFARQLSHPHPGAHSPQACCPAEHMLPSPTRSCLPSHISTPPPQSSAHPHIAWSFQPKSFPWNTGSIMQPCWAAHGLQCQRASLPMLSKR